MLQSTVKRTQALGSAGEIYKAEHSYLNTVMRLVTDDITRVGCFVQAGTAENEIIMASGQAITGDIIGVVVKGELRNSLTDTDLVLKGTNQAVLNEGNIFIKANGIIAQNSYVFLKTADGSLAFSTSKTLADHTYTGFKVDIGNASAGDCIIGITTAGNK